jgi:hypothetical protein
MSRLLLRPCAERPCLPLWLSSKLGIAYLQRATRKKHGRKADARDQHHVATQRSDETGSAARSSLAVPCGQSRPPFWPACGFGAATYRAEGRRRRSPRPRAASRCQPVWPARARSWGRGTPKRPAQGLVSRACRACRARGQQGVRAAPPAPRGARATPLSAAVLGGSAPPEILSGSPVQWPTPFCP